MEHRPCHASRANVADESALASSEGADSESDDLDIDLFNDLVVVSSQSKGIKEGACEDRVLDKFKLPLEYIGSSASCVMMGVMDGHGGSACVEYVKKQLPVSLLSIMHNPMKRKSSDTDNVANVIRKAFQITDHNFLHMAKRTTDNSGSTIACVTFFGPDSVDGQLRVLLGSLGDSRAVLYKLVHTTSDMVGIGVHASSPIHKPTMKSEMKRIVNEGGHVTNIQGVDRVIRRITNGRSVSTVGLSVSRAFGDLLMKEPKPIISSVPEFMEATIDFDCDQFLVMGTDGVFDFISEEEIGNMIASAGRSRQELSIVADKIVDLAKSRGSGDDRTCVIVDFAWATRPTPTPTVNEASPGLSTTRSESAISDELFVGTS
jgi:serine/threonine protein phosphatase PrpC